MINKTNFWIGLAVAVLMAVGLLAGREPIAAGLADAGFGPAFFGAPLADPLLMATIAVALGTLAWMIIGWAVPMIGLEAEIGAALEDDADPNEASFTTVNEKLGGSLSRLQAEPDTGALPAATGPSLLNQFADAWFFRALPLAALGLGTLIAMVSLIHSHPAATDSIDGALYEALDLAAPSSGAVALGCFVTAASGAFFSALLYWLTSGAVAARLDRLIAAARARLHGQDAYRLEYRIAEALAPVADSLSAAAEKLADTQNRTSQVAMEEACARFLNSLDSATGIRTAALADSMSALERSASGLLDAVAQTETRLSAAQEAHGAQVANDYAATLRTLQEQQAEQINALAGEFRAMTAELRAITNAAVQSISDQMSQTSKATQQAVGLLAQKAESATSIGQAADQMAAAAKASRDTVEQFIALAERMRDLSHSITPAASPSLANSFAEGLGAPANTSPLPKRIEPPFTSPETAKRLSSAIRNLKQAVDQPLPEL